MKYNPLLLGCGIAFLLGVALLIGVVVWLVQGPESGVKLSNQMDKYATDYLVEHKILQPAENLIAYYDATIKMDGTEAAILTDKRVLYHNNGKTAAIDLAEIDEIRHRKERLLGDIIEIYARSGESMNIEIAPLNNGETFLNALKNASQKAKVAD